jgi:hypothetical protein
MEFKLNLFGHPYWFFIEKGYRKSSGNWGKHNAETLCIVVDGDSQETIKRETLLHEFGEAINFWYELGLNHQQITIFTKSLWDIFGSNPEMLKWFCKTIEEK